MKFEHCCDPVKLWIQNISVLQFSNELLNLNEGFVLTHFNHVDNLKRNQK